MKKIILQHSMLLIPTVFLFWFLAYPNTLRWLEAISFFSILPDFAFLQAYEWKDLPDYVGAFLLQFYRWPAVGALIQTIIAWLIMVSADVIICRLLHRHSVAWLSFVVVSLLLAFQIKNFFLGTILMITLASVLLALVVALLVPKKSMEGKLSSWIGLYLLPFVLMLGGMMVSISDEENSVRERIHRVEFLAEEENWDKILELVTPEVAREDPVRRRYALLALLEKGLLPEMMFKYGVESANDFFFQNSKDYIGLTFNNYFFRAIGGDNEIVRSMFQLNINTRFGFSSRAMRAIVDALLHQGDRVLAEKYLRILSSSWTNRGWAKSRYKKLRDLYLNPVTEPNPEIDTWADAHSENGLIMDMVIYLEADPNNRKAVDILLCAGLGSRQLEQFNQFFAYYAPRVYQGVKSIPTHYEEAILLCSRQDPSVLQRYPISSFKRNEFNRFAQIMDSGDTKRAEAMYQNTYWGYHYFRR